MLELGPGRAGSGSAPAVPAQVTPALGAGCYPGQQEPLWRAGLPHLLGCRTWGHPSPLQSWDVGSSGCCCTETPKKIPSARERKEEERRKGVFQNLMEEVGAPGGAPAPFPAPIPKGEGLEG